LVSAHLPPGELVSLRVTIHVKPGASRTGVGGGHGEALVVRVTPPAAGGRATGAALRAIAEAFGVHRRQVTLVSGTRSRQKIVQVEGDRDALADRLLRLRGG
jgi:uncharacterized protein